LNDPRASASDEPHFLKAVSILSSSSPQSPQLRSIYTARIIKVTRLIPGPIRQLCSHTVKQHTEKRVVCSNPNGNLKCRVTAKYFFASSGFAGSRVLILNDVVWRKSNPMPTFAKRFTKCAQYRPAVRDETSKYTF
jgi:hypothetical protein